MITRTLAVMALLAPAAAHAACSTATTVEALDGALGEAEEAYRSVDLDGFTLSMDSASLLLPCLGEAISPDVAARFHRMRGLSSVIGRKNDQAAKAFTAAKAADPDYTWPEDLIPPGHVIRTTYEAADPSESKFDAPAPPTNGELVFDGAASTERPATRPTIFQWVDGEGAVVVTKLLKPGAKLPDYPAKEVPKPEPVAEAPTPEPTGEPVGTETTVTDPGGTSGAIALPAALTGGAVALGAGSAALFFGPTKGAYVTYQDMRSDGRYADAEEHFKSSVVPVRTASQVLAGAAVVSLGVGAYFWSQTVEVQPMPNGLRLQGRF